jgi:phosphocarrier protein
MPEVAEGVYEIVNALGLHARAAAQLVKVANRFKCEVALESDGNKVNGKSIMGVLMLAAGKGSQVKITCTGDDGATCLDAIRQLIANKFGEEQ